ncbi:MAG TPA: hypothetical protein VJO12_03595 [Stellaceae bacterium]|nr:hypothetical protein [Stellaceae bacterium]
MLPSCGWFTKTDISAALGEPVTELQEKVNMVTDKPRGCPYKTADVMKFASVDAFERDNAEDAQRYFAQLTKHAARVPGNNPPNPITPVAGLGDETAGVANVLYVRKGTVIFSLAVFDSNKTPTTTPTGFAKAKALAQGALSRL